MNKSVLVFPDTRLMSDFIFASKISGLETNSIEISVIGFFTEVEIRFACLNFNARLRNPVTELQNLDVFRNFYSLS